MNEDIDSAAEVISAGGIILYPTDTIWGIGCDAENSAAVERIFSIKRRPEAKSMIILVDSEKMLFRYAGDLPDVALDILRVSDKPVTIIYPGVRGIAAGLTAEDGSAGIRVTRDPFCTGLMRKTRVPIVSTSANISGMPWPRMFTEIDPEIRASVDYVVKWRQDERTAGKPSGIIRVWPDGTVKVIREQAQ